ncbi:RNA polymerase sigma factor, partial [Luedemannella flava]|uniref:RNA polymerase sigma factor n=1 Tax=Luedemannella flava TaxID=349316 RepID=UPI0031E0B856
MNPQPPADLTAAVARARLGDEDGFRSVYRHLQPGLLRYLTGLVGGDAEDVAAEAWEQIARDIRSFQGDGDGFRRWAVTIARHRALDHLRRQRRRPAVPTAGEEFADLPADENTEARAMDALGTEAALALIASLPPDQAEAVLLRAVMGLDAASAGEILGKRPGAVRMAAYRGLRTLAGRLVRQASAAFAGGTDEEGTEPCVTRSGAPALKETTWVPMTPDFSTTPPRRRSSTVAGPARPNWSPCWPGRQRRRRRT